MIRRLVTSAGHFSETTARSPLAVPMLVVGGLLIAAGLACSSPVEMVIGALCLVASMARPGA